MLDTCGYHASQNTQLETLLKRDQVKLEFGFANLGYNDAEKDNEISTM